MRTARAVALLLLGIAGSQAEARAEDWPTRPIKFIQGFAPGGTTDIVARLIAVPLAAQLGQPVVVDNRPGAGGTLGADLLTKAKPDGYTMMLINSGYTVAAALYRTLPYDPVADIQPAGLIATMGLVILAAPAAGDLGALIARAKAAPGRLNVGTVGAGSTQDLVAAAFEAMAGIKLTHVPYRGTPLAIAALRGGEVDLLVETTSAVLGQVRSGELKALAVTTAQRFPGLPAVPTLAEAGVAGPNLDTWYGIVFPAGTPAPIVARVTQASRAVLAAPELQRQFGDLGLVSTGGGSPEAMGAHIKSEVARWAALIASAGVERQ